MNKNGIRLLLVLLSCATLSVSADRPLNKEVYHDFSLQEWVAQQEERELLALAQASSQPLTTQESKTRIVQWLAAAVCVTFLWNCIQITTHDGKVLYTFHPTSTALAWAGKSFQFAAQLLQKAGL